MESILLFDQNFLLFIQEHIRLEWLNPIVMFITSLGNSGIIWIILGLVLVCFKKTRRAGILSLLCLIVAWLVNDFILKEIFARTRPYEVIEGLTHLGKAEGSFSFPSGHTNASFAAAFGLTAGFGKKGAWSYVLATLIAFSRCYVGVHYLTDILAGMIVGTVMAFVAYKLFEYLAPRIEENLKKRASNK